LKRITSALLLLAYLSEAAGDELIFQRRTCLTKVHSELLPPERGLGLLLYPFRGDSPDERSKRAEQVKIRFKQINRAGPVFRLIETMKGATTRRNNVAVIGYDSMLGQQKETIKVEVSCVNRCWRR